MLDEQGRRFAPQPAGSDIPPDAADKDAVPLDVLLQPQQSLDIARTFQLPPGAHAVGIITGHGSPYCGTMSFLVIGGSGCLFHKPAMIRLE